MLGKIIKQTLAELQAMLTKLFHCLMKLVAHSLKMDGHLMTTKTMMMIMIKKMMMISGIKHQQLQLHNGLLQDQPHLQEGQVHFHLQEGQVHPHLQEGQVHIHLLLHLKNGD